MKRLPHKRPYALTVSHFLVGVIVVAVTAVPGIILLAASHAQPQPAITKTVKDITANSAVHGANDANLGASVGDIVEFTVTVKNTAGTVSTHANDLVNVKMTDDVPAAVQLVSNPKQTTISEDFGTIAPGKSVSRQYQAKVLPWVAGKTFKNKACFSGNNSAGNDPLSGCSAVLVDVSNKTATPSPGPAPGPGPATPPPSTGGSGGGSSGGGASTSKTGTKSSGSTGAKSGSSSAPGTTAQTSAACTDASDVQTASGSVGARVTIPLDGAAGASVKYGESAGKINQQSPQAAVDGSQAVVELTGLEPGRQYYYQAIRQCGGGKTTTTAVMTFETAKLGVNIFYKLGSKPVGGIKGIFNGVTATSGADGKTSYQDVLPGNYKLIYSYDKKQYTTTILVGRPDVKPGEDISQPSTLDFTVVPGGAGSRQRGIMDTFWPWLFGFVVIAAGVFLLLRRRKGRLKPVVPEGPDNQPPGLAPGQTIVPAAQAPGPEAVPQGPLGPAAAQPPVPPQEPISPQQPVSLQESAAAEPHPSPQPAAAATPPPAPAQPAPGGADSPPLPFEFEEVPPGTSYVQPQAMPVQPQSVQGPALSESVPAPTQEQSFTGELDLHPRSGPQGSGPQQGPPSGNA